jgi:hypothetical protein
MLRGSIRYAVGRFSGVAGLAVLLTACGGSGGSGGGEGGGDLQVQGTTYYVTTLTDSGPGSLRNLVEDVAPTAPEGEVFIRFAPALAGGTVSLIAPIVPTVDLSIDGSGPGGTPGERIQISGLDATRLFEIAEGLEITIAHVVLRNGWTNGYGGAIETEGRLFLRNALVHANFAGAGGGAIRAQGENSGLSIRRCAFVDNEADWGGAVMASQGWFVSEFSSFTFNNASVGGGGALWFVDMSATLSNCTVHGNTASDDDLAEAAAIRVVGNAGSGDHVLTLLHCTITGNSSAAATGPAVNVEREATFTMDVVVRGTIIAENTGPLNGDFDFHAGDGPGSATITYSILGVGNASTIGFDGVDGNYVGTLMLPADPMLTVLTPLFGPGDGRVHRFAEAGSPALDLVPLGAIHNYNGPVIDEDQRERVRGLDGFTDAGATDVESP